MHLGLGHLNSRHKGAKDSHFPNKNPLLPTSCVKRVPGARCTALRRRGADVKTGGNIFSRGQFLAIN